MCSRSEAAGDLATAVERLLGWERAELVALPHDVLADDLRALERIAAQLEAVRLRLVEVFDRRGDALADGAASTAAWLRWQCRLAPGAARERVEVARRLADDLPETRAALAAGNISYRHAAVINSTVADLPSETVADAEATLADAARRFDPASVGRLGRHVRHLLDREGALADADRAHQARRLHISTTFDGMVAIDGLLDSEAGSTVLTAIAAQAGPPPPDDRRTPAQRRADALVELARAALDRGELREAGGERPHLVVTVDLPTLLATPARPRPVAGRQPARDAAISGVRAAELGWVGPVCGETARRLACDAGVVRVLTAGPSEVLDVGRQTRVVGPALRRALVVRDGRCRFPGCDRPPPFTDAHHIAHWADGGETRLDNLVLLCRHHHRYVHECGWVVTLDADGGFTVCPPSGPAPPVAGERTPQLGRVEPLARGA